MDDFGPSKLHERCREARIDPALWPRRDHFIQHRWLIWRDVRFDDGLGTLADDAPSYRALSLPSGETLRRHLARLSPADRGELAFAIAPLGVSNAVLMRDFPLADGSTLEAVSAVYGLRRKGRAPTSRKMFRSLPIAAQANCFIDCFVRRRCYGAFDPVLFVDGFRHAYSAYRALADGFSHVLSASEAWAALESALSGELRLMICEQTGQPFFRHAASPGHGLSPFLRPRRSSPSHADRALMHLLDRSGCLGDAQAGSCAS